MTAHLAPALPRAPIPAPRTAQDVVRRAKEDGASFRLSGAEVVVEHAQLLNDTLFAELSARRSEIWTWLGGAALDAPSLDLLAELKVSVCVPQSEAEALAALAQIEANSEHSTADGRIGFDIETAAIAGEEVRQPVKIGRDGSVLQLPALDPLHLRRRHDPGSTAGLDPLRSTIRLAQLYGGGEVCLVLDTRLVPLAVLGPLLGRRKLVIHNAAFELAFLRHAAEKGGLPEAIAPKFECTMQAAGLLYGVQCRGLADAAREGLGIELPKDLQVSDWGADRLSPGQHAYAALDAIVALRVWQKLRLDLMEKHRGPAYVRQRDVIPAVVRMQARGMALDSARHQAWMEARGIELHDAREAFQAATGLSPSATPAAQRAWLEAALPAEDRAAWPRTDKTHELSIRAQDLKRAVHIPGIAELCSIKKQEKLLTAFGTILAARVASDGRLHASFNVASTKTGRMSCNQPNLQQCPRDPEFRACFTAGSGRVLVIGDYSSMELRALAAISKEPAMRADFCDPDFDPHRRLAAAINGISEAEVTDEQRQGAKAINFGTVYGAGPAGLAASAWSSWGIKLTLRGAQEARNHFFARYPGLPVWMRSHANYCQRQGRIVIGNLGRVIEAAWERVPTGLARHRSTWPRNSEEDPDDDLDTDSGLDGDLDDDQPRRPGPVPALKYTLCCNAPVQGACADDIMLALILIDRELPKAGIDGWPILAAHDELVLEVLEEQASAAAALLEKCMVEAFQKTFPGAPVTNLVNLKTASTWEKP